MSAYMTAVIVCASVTAIAGIVMPSDGASSKYIKYISGLVTLCVMAAPLFELFDGDKIELPVFSIETEQYEFDIRESIIERAEASLSVTVADDIAAVFNLEGSSVDAFVTLDSSDFDDVKIASVTVTLRGGAVWTDAESLTEYISSYYDCEVNISYE